MTREQQEQINTQIQQHHVPIGTQVSVAIFVVGVIWAAAIGFAELKALTEWRDQIQSNRFTESDAEIMRRELLAEIRALNDAHMAQFQSLTDRSRYELAQERSFIRSLCFAVGSLQDAQGIPVTNDCGRP